MQIRVDIRKFVSHWSLHLNRRSLSGIAKPSLNVISGFRMQSHQKNNRQALARSQKAINNQHFIFES